MDKKFTIEMLPGREGDCLWIEYGAAADVHRILIDGGRKGTWKALSGRIDAAADKPCHFDLMVITHVDADHIEGVLELLKSKSKAIVIDEIWFNGWKHLDENEIETFGPVQGEMLTYAITKRKIKWNSYFNGKAVAVPKTGFGDCTLPGGMNISLLSPTRESLLTLKPVWEKACADAGIKPGAERYTEPPSGFESFGALDVDKLAGTSFQTDPSETNGSSIAFIAKFEQKSLLLAGDAHPDVLLEGIKKRQIDGKKLPIDAFKVPHHGSKYNFNNDLLGSVACSKYLISTSGARFNHPDPETIAKIIKNGGNSPELYFNYKSTRTEIWDNEQLIKKYGYSAIYKNEENGEVINIL
jgi:hypothetical protein